MNRTIDKSETQEEDDLISLLNDDNEDGLGGVGTPKRGNVWLRPLINLLVLALLSVAGYALYNKYFKTDAIGPKQYKIIAASTGKVKKTIAASGTLQPWSTVDIKSKAGGRVDALLVNVGNEVKAGQILARIDPSDSLLTYKQSEADVSSAQARIDQGGYQYELQKKQSALAIQNAKVQLFSAQANLRAAQARLETGKTQETAQPALTRAAIANAQASYDQAVQSRAQLDATDPQSRATAKATYDQAIANRDNAKQSLERQISLAKQGFVSQQTVDTAKATLAVNESQVTSAAERLKNIEGELRASVQSADARVAQAKASLEQAKTQSMEVANKRNSTKELEAAGHSGAGWRRTGAGQPFGSDSESGEHRHQAEGYYVVASHDVPFGSVVQQRQNDARSDHRSRSVRRSRAEKVCRTGNYHHVRPLAERRWNQYRATRRHLADVY